MRYPYRVPASILDVGDNIGVGATTGDGVYVTRRGTIFSIVHRNGKVFYLTRQGGVIAMRAEGADISCILYGRAERPQTKLDLEILDQTRERMDA